MKPSSRRAASFEYSGSSAISEAAVWMESRSSSFVVAPLYKPPIVLLATRMASTDCSPAQQRLTARTILFTSAGSRFPFRFRTCICEEFPDEGNASTESGTAARTGVAMDAFSPTREEGQMKWEWSLKTEDTSSSPTSPRRLARYSRRVWRGYWQVFGLAGGPFVRTASLLTHLPGFGENQWCL